MKVWIAVVVRFGVLPAALVVVVVRWFLGRRRMVIMAVEWPAMAVSLPA